MFLRMLPATEASRIHGSGAQRQAPDGARVALVCMPWVSLETPPIAIGLLKRYVQAAGFVPELYYLNVRFAERIGLERYERIARSGYVHTEWFFSQALFGSRGTGEMANDWQHIRSDASARSVAGTLTHALGLSERDCEQLASQHVPAFIDEYANGIDWSQYLVVGFTTMFAQSLATLFLAQRIKAKHPHVRIVLGGANVEAEMGVAMMQAFDWIDFVVHGEADLTFPALLDHLTSGRGDLCIPGVSARQGSDVWRGDLAAPPTVNLNDVPAPDYSDYFDELALANFADTVPVSLFFESSRGCWWGAKHHCTFCGLNGSTMAYRKKDAAKVYAEIVELANTYRCLHLSAADNILGNESFTDLLPMLTALDSDVSLFYSVKANLRRAQLQLMADAGVVAIQPGIESFNSRLLDLMRKGVTGIQNIQLLKWCRELGLQASYNILYGFPQETPDDYAALPRTLRMIGHLQPPGDVIPIVIERFSPYFFDKDRFALQYQPWRVYGDIYPTPRVDIPKVAYFFDGSWAGQTDEPEAYIAPARAVVHEWRTHAAGNEVFCEYDKGPDYVRVHDNRPFQSAAPLRTRAFDLDERSAALFLFCDRIHSFQAIAIEMQSRFGPDATEQAVRAWLDALIDQRLIFQEGDRYLTLAVRRAGSRNFTRRSTRQDGRLAASV